MKISKSILVLSLALLAMSGQIYGQSPTTEEQPETEGTEPPPTTGNPVTTASTAPPTTTGAPASTPSTPAPTAGPTTTAPTTTQRPTTVDGECDHSLKFWEPLFDIDCPEEQDIPSYYPYPYDCTKFLVCTNGEIAVECCAEGTRWDQDLLTCNHESAIPCVIVTTQTAPPTTTTTPTTTTPTTTTPTTTTPTTTTPTTTTPTTTTPSTTTDIRDWVCPEGYLGPIAHPFNCSYFYICDGIRRPCLFMCNDGLYFNPDIGDCDWPFNVPSCEGGSPITTSPRPPMEPEPMLNYRTMTRREPEHPDLFQATTGNPCDEPRLNAEFLGRVWA